MKYIKHLFLTLGLLMGITYSTNAAQITQTVGPNLSTNILVGAGRIQQFVLTSTGGASNLLQFVDSPNTNLFFTLSAYSNIVVSTGSFTNIYTNYFGVSTTNIYTAQQTTTNSVAAATLPYNGLLTAQVSANSTLTIGNAVTFPAGSTYYFYQGVTVTNASSQNAVVTLTYQQ